MLYVLFNILNLLRRHDELLSNFSPAGFTFKGFVVCTMLLTEQRFFCLEVPLGDLGQLKGLLAPKQRLTEASMFTIPRFYFTTQSITLLKLAAGLSQGRSLPLLLYYPTFRVFSFQKYTALLIEWSRRARSIFRDSNLLFFLHMPVTSTEVSNHVWKVAYSGISHSWLGEMEEQTTNTVSHDLAVFNILSSCF